MALTYAANLGTKHFGHVYIAVAVVVLHEPVSVSVDIADAAARVRLLLLWPYARQQAVAFAIQGVVSWPQTGSPGS